MARLGRVLFAGSLPWLAACGARTTLLLGTGQADSATVLRDAAEVGTEEASLEAATPEASLDGATDAEDSPSCTNLCSATRMTACEDGGVSKCVADDAGCFV
jgi:hypothetical protein